MSMIPPAGESVPNMGPAPPDAMPETLQDLLDKAIALIAQDRMLSPDEMQAVSNFLQQVQMVAQAKMAGGQPDATQQQVQSRQQQSGFTGGQPQERQIMPYGQSPNPNVQYGGGQ